MVGCRSDPDDKIATDLGSKSTTKNRIATRVTSATGPDLQILAISSYLSLYIECLAFSGHKFYNFLAPDFIIFFHTYCIFYLFESSHIACFAFFGSKFYNFLSPNSISFLNFLCTYYILCFFLALDFSHF